MCVFDQIQSHVSFSLQLKDTFLAPMNRQPSMTYRALTWVISQRDVGEHPVFVVHFPLHFLSVCVSVCIARIQQNQRILIRLLKHLPYFLLPYSALYTHTHTHTHPIVAHLQSLGRTLSIIQCLHSNWPDLRGGSGDTAPRQAHWAEQRVQRSLSLFLWV